MCCPNRVARLTRIAGIKAQIGYKRRPGIHGGRPSVVVDNALDRQFDAAAADTAWGDNKLARRYHWLSEGLTSFLDTPHSAIEGKGQGEIINLADHRADRSRKGQLDLLASLGPDKIVRELGALEVETMPAKATVHDKQPMLPHLIMPAHHDVRGTDVNMRRLHGNLAAAADRGPVDFESLLLTPGVGARTVKALAMVAEVVHGAPCRFSDPARFSLAHGGKDRHPFPVPLKVYDETISFMKSAVRNGRLGRDEELQALKRLDEQSRQLERYVTGPDLKEIVAGEFVQSPLLGGRSVFGWEGAPETELDGQNLRRPGKPPDLRQADFWRCERSY
jgi:hypothetical protein